jgi:hypothetical protein
VTEEAAIAVATRKPLRARSPRGSFRLADYPVRSVRLAHRPTIAPSLYQIWPTAGTKFGFDLRCKSRFSNGFTALALNAVPSSIVFRFAPGRGRTAAPSRRNGRACGAQTMPPAGPTKAAPMQSPADEKAQISEVTPARSRMHQVSALPPATAFAREGTGTARPPV